MPNQRIQSQPTQSLDFFIFISLFFLFSLSFFFSFPRTLTAETLPAQYEEDPGESEDKDTEEIPSEIPTVELITFEPGDSIWSRFGHIGIRVMDPTYGTDLIYDYGHAKFESLYFIVEYLKGQCTFYLSVRYFDQVVAKYSRFDRTIVSQKLNLSPEQTENLINRLNHESLPENREYIYDQLQKNCATKLRDLLNNITNGALEEEVQNKNPGKTYRDYTLQYGAGSIPVQLGMDLTCGPNHDQILDGWSDLYLPINLQKLISRTEHTIDGKKIPLAQEPRIIYSRKKPPPLHGSHYFSRYLFLALCCFGGVLFAIGGRAATRPTSAISTFLIRSTGLIITLYSLFFGVLGGVLLFLALQSTSADYGWSHNIFVFWVLDLGLVITGFRWLVLKRNWITKFLRGYIILRLVVLIGLLLSQLAGFVDGQDNWVYISGSCLVLGGLLIGMQIKEKKEEEESW